MMDKILIKLNENAEKIVKYLKNKKYIYPWSSNDK